jgi:hypothetical protein
MALRDTQPALSRFGMIPRSFFLAGIVVWGALPPAAHSAGAFMEPKDGRCYFGFFFRVFDSPDPEWGDSRPFASRFKEAIDQELGGKKPSLFGVVQSWQTKEAAPEPFEVLLNKIRRFEEVIGAPSIPVVAWDSKPGSPAPGSRYLGLTTKDVWSGRVDEFLRQYARDVKAYGKPILFRPICHEMNGSWHQHCSPLANPALTPADYVKAWQHVVTLFRREGVTNVGWVWNAASFPVGPVHERIDRNLESYYPGNDYVDWLGGDFYDQGSPRDPRSNPLNPNAYLDPLYAMALRHGKPFLLGEWGIRHRSSRMTPAQHEVWLRQVFNYVETHPKIKGILYFNYKERGAPGRARKVIPFPDGEVIYNPDSNDGDFRLIAEGHAHYRRLFAQRIRSDRYISLDESAFGAVPRPAAPLGAPRKKD